MGSNGNLLPFGASLKRSVEELQVFVLPGWLQCGSGEFAPWLQQDTGPLRRIRLGSDFHLPRAAWVLDVRALVIALVIQVDFFPAIRGAIS